MRDRVGVEWREGMGIGRRERKNKGTIRDGREGKEEDEEWRVGGKNRRG